MARVRQWGKIQPRRPPDSPPSTDKACAESPDAKEPSNMAPVIDVDMSSWRAEGRRVTDQGCTSWSDFLQACEAPEIISRQSGTEERPSKRRRIEENRQSTARALITAAPVEGFLILGSFDVSIESPELDADSDALTLVSPCAVDLSARQISETIAPHTSGLELDLRPFSDSTSDRRQILSILQTGPRGQELLLCISRLYNDKSSRSVLRQARDYLRIQCSLTEQRENSATLQQNARRYSIQITIWWKENVSYQELRTRNDIALIWHACLDEFQLSGNETAHMPSKQLSQWTPQAFYESVHAPPLEQVVPEELQSREVDCTLYPFQKRAVAWMLKREGVCFKDGALSLYKTDDEMVKALAPTFSRGENAAGQSVYYSRFCGVALQDLQALKLYSTIFSGGVLAEEMGLGKTIELISLVYLHKRRITETDVYDAYTGTCVTASGATLIVTPAHILQQWLSEIQTHAPRLRVFHYQGMVRDGKKNITAQDLLEYDIVLTTYNVLAKEIHYATEGPDRSLRHEKVYERRRSPLIQTSWWRVCLDEAQLIESGVSQAATVARLIPRINAWAVTGTPVKKHLDDLRGLLVFLRFEPFASTKKMWLDIERFQPKVLSTIFNDVTLRHGKSYIRHELQLPPQQRVVINLPFSAIEEQYYSEAVQKMCEDCGFAPDGSPGDRFFDPEDPVLRERMRYWVRHLRQICLHPRMTDRARRRLGGDAPLRTVGQVLETMMDGNETLLRTQERELIDSIVVQSHIQAFDKSNQLRAQTALDGYRRALARADALVLDCRQTLIEEQNRLKTTANLKSSRNVSSEPDQDEDEDGSDENADPKKHRINACRNSLRQSLLLQHVAKFFVASAYYQLKENGDTQKEDPSRYKELEALEVQFYDEAKKIRSELLHEAQLRAEKASKEIRQRVTEGSFTKVEEIADIDDDAGIENRKILDICDEVLERLDQQSAYIRGWRERILSLLQKPLVDQDEGQETTGDEYEDSTKIMDELYVYTAVMRAIVADRQSALSGQYGVRADMEMKEALRAAKDGEGASAELMLRLGTQRQKVRYKQDDPSLRGVIAQLRELATSLQWRSKTSTDRAAMELSIVEGQIKKIQVIISSQSKIITELEKEQELFHHAMNQRVEFYRQLQVISDTVQPYKEELQETADENELAGQIDRETKANTMIDQLRTKRRFLIHLRDEAEDQSGGRVCVICTDRFETGVITVCGHQYCKECIKLWWQSHRTCPVCKKGLKLADFHDITYKPQEVQIVAESASSPNKKSFDSTATSDSAGSSPAMSEGWTNGEQTRLYSQMNSRMMVEIKSIDLPGSYGTKIDTLARHLIWLRTNDPGAKSIVFSQFSDFLELLSEALTQFKIGHVSIKGKGVERFRRDPGIEVALLDAKTDNSGLNLVNATHVFLFEPLINTALELQAIARVHRIGQLRMTHVYMYLVRDTVEEAVYDISVKRRMEHILSSQDRTEKASKKKGRGQKDKIMQTLRETDAEGPELSKAELALESAESRELQQASLGQLLKSGKTGGGEIVKDDDLWNILFLRPRIPQANLVGTLGESVEGMQEVRRQVNRDVRANAAERRSLAQ